MFLDISNKHIVEHSRKLLSFVVVLVLVVRVVFVRRGLVVVVAARGRSWPLLVVLVVLVRRGLVVWSWPRSRSSCASCSFVVVSSLASWRRCLVVVGAHVCNAIVTLLLGLRLWGGKAFLQTQNHHKPIRN